MAGVGLVLWAWRRLSFISTAALIAVLMTATSCQCSVAAQYCEPITQPVCITSGVSHRFTKTPIVVTTGHRGNGDNPDGLTTVYRTQREAATAMDPYQPLLARARGCREYLRPLLCSVYLPACGVEGGREDSAPPCRDLCQRAWRGCSRAMRFLGLVWGPALNCQQFPTLEENPSCISALRLGEVRVQSPSANTAPKVSLTCYYDLSPSVPLEWLMPNGTRVSDDPSEPIHAERIGKDALRLVLEAFVDLQHAGNYTCTTKDQGFRHSFHLGNIFESATGPSCEAITIPYCQDQLTYSLTSLSESHSIFSSQSQVDDFIRDVLQPGDCSPHMQALLCSYLLPKCDEYEVHHNILPCREVCDKVFSDCRHLVDAGIMRGLPAPCDVLPYSDPNVKCYSGVEFGPARFPAGWTFGSITMELECRTKASSLRTAIITLPSGASYSLNHPPHLDGIYRLQVREVDDRTFKLVVRQFSVKVDSGVYTCSDGSLSQSAVVRDVPTTCVPIAVPRCVGQLSYSSVQLPNLYGSRHQREMEEQLRQFDGLLLSDCSAFAGTLLCTPFLTRCGTRSDAQQVTLCRDLCDRVKRDCGSVLEAEGLESFSCDMFPYQKDKACYNGLELGPIQVSNIPGGMRVQVECRHPPVRKSDWLLPGEQSEHLKTRDQDAYTSLLVIDGFQGDDEGVYTCSDGTFAQEVNITTALVSQGGTKTLHLSTETQASEDGNTVITLECASSVLPSPVQSQSWLLPNGTELNEGQRAHHVRASMVSGGVSHLVITDFQASDAGQYTCHMDGRSVSTTLNYDIPSHSPEMTQACEEIEDDTCRRLLGYDLTWIHPFSLRIDALLMALVANGNASVEDSSSCSIHLQTLGCLHRFPPCAGQAVAEQRLPCRELCTQAEAECRGAGAGSNLQLACHKLPSQAHTSCFSGVLISPVEYRTKVIGRTTVEVRCTYLAGNQSVTWRTPDGRLIADDGSSSSLSARPMGGGTVQLTIPSFDAASHQGVYTCLVHGLQASVAISDRELPKGSCQRIDHGFCSEGVGYTHAYFPSSMGHRTVAEAAAVFRLFGSVDPDALLCSPYARPLLCSSYFLPCDPEADTPAPLHLVPCRELCLKNLAACRQGSHYAPQDCVQTNGGPLPCYDVDEVTVGNQVSSSGSRAVSVDCTYNLLPKYQPRWFLPNGQPVQRSDAEFKPRVLHVSPTSSRLVIGDSMADAGTYTCSGPNTDVTVIIGKDDI